MGINERFPHNRLADVGRDEEGNTRAQTVSLLQQLVKQQHNETGDEQLQHDENADACSEVTWLTVHTRHHISVQVNACACK